jgi:hypothetical protein
VALQDAQPPEAAAIDDVRWGQTAIGHTTIDRARGARFALGHLALGQAAIVCGINYGLVQLVIGWSTG